MPNKKETIRAKFHFNNIYEEMNRVVGPYILYQIGDLCCEPGYIIHRHTQRVFEISYIAAGRGEFYADYKKYEVKKGDLFINRIGEQHEIRTSSLDPIRFFYLGFDFAEANGDQEYIGRLKGFFRDNDRRKIGGAGEMHDLFVSALSEFVRQDDFFDTMLAAYIQKILITTYRLFTGERHKNYSIRSEDTTQKLVFDIVHYIDTETEHITELAGLSEIFGYSYFNISQKFKSVMGENLKTYLQKRRFEKAKESILKGYTITQTAKKYGYQSVHAFSRAFRNHTGMTPTAYKKHILTGEEGMNETL